MNFEREPKRGDKQAGRPLHPVSECRSMLQIKKGLKKYLQLFQIAGFVPGHFQLIRKA